jgi:hypothetical protein
MEQHVKDERVCACVCLWHDAIGVPLKRVVLSRAHVSIAGDDEVETVLHRLFDGQITTKARTQAFDYLSRVLPNKTRERG